MSCMFFYYLESDSKESNTQFYRRKFRDNIKIILFCNLLVQFIKLLKKKLIFKIVTMSIPYLFYIRYSTYRWHE